MHGKTDMDVTTTFSTFGKEIYVNSSYIAIILNAVVKMYSFIRFSQS